jgi:hypothetical protein
MAACTKMAPIASKMALADGLPSSPSMCHLRHLCATFEAFSQVAIAIFEALCHLPAINTRKGGGWWVEVFRIEGARDIVNPCAVALYKLTTYKRRYDAMPPSEHSRRTSGRMTPA